MAMISNLVNENILPKLETAHNKHKDQKGILEVQDLSAWYRNTLAIKHITMTIQSQTITSIIGDKNVPQSFLGRANQRHFRL